MMKNKLWLLTMVLIALALVAVACGGGAAEEAAEGEPAAAEEGAEEASGEGEGGGTVTVFSAATDDAARLLEDGFDSFTEETGIEVVVEGSADFETLIRVRVEGGDPPDIAAFPQPGLLRSLARQGAMVDLGIFLDEEYMQQQYDQSWLDMGTVDGQLVGIWHNADVKSLVWYPTPEFEEAGYEIPETWDEMIALSDQIVADGGTPWCIGIESSGATGWVATDWVEDIMLRTNSPETYDQWVRGELPFNSPEVKRAVEIMGDIWLNPDYVLGGTTSIQATPFGDAPTPLFDQPPSCWLHRQASFITLFFPEDVELGTDVKYFYLPPIDEEFGKPVLASGGIFGMLNDRPEVRQVMEYLTTGQSARVEIEAGMIVGVQNDVDLGWYPSDFQAGYAEILSEADTVRFDGSDLMPSEVGTGTFWTGMVDYVSGADLETVLQTIDESWPEE